MLNEASYRRLRGKLSIDQLRIDDELMELPVYIMEASENVSEALQIRDNCKNRLDVLLATAARRLRAVPVSDDGKAPKARSEAAIADEKYLDDDVQGGVSELEIAKYDLSLWNGLLDGLKEKSSSVRRVAELMMGGFLTNAQVYQERRAEMAAARAAAGPVLRRRE